METTQNLLNNDLQLDARIAGHLKETAGWAKFLGIVGIIFSAIIAIIAFYIPTYLNNRSYNPYSSYGYSRDTQMMGTMLTVVYIIVAILFFFVSLFTFRFGNKTKQALLSADQESLDKGLMNLKFIFRFYGIVTILYLGLLVLGLLAAGMRGFN